MLLRVSYKQQVGRGAHRWTDSLEAESKDLAHELQRLSAAAKEAGRTITQVLISSAEWRGEG
jgi:hypothetical protein